MKLDNHFVSVIVPTVGRSTIKTCTDSLKKQTRKPDEIIVVKDERRLGVSWARNEGIRKSRGDLIAFTDDDCVPPKDWLERLVKIIDKYSSAGAGGPYRETDSLLRDMWKRRGFPTKEQVDTKGFVKNTGNVMYKLSWLKKLQKQDGYIFNEKAKYAEDTGLAWRLQSLGATLIFTPINVVHLRSTTLLKHLRHQFGRGIGIAYLHYFLKIHKKKIRAEKSLIWDNAGNIKANWLWGFWYKVIGPFDVHSFRRKRDFWLFWLGEKAQALGFIWGLISQKGKERK